MTTTMYASHPPSSSRYPSETSQSLGPPAPPPGVYSGIDIIVPKRPRENLLCRSPGKEYTRLVGRRRECEMGCGSSALETEDAPTVVNHVDDQLAEAAAAERFHFKVNNRIAAMRGY